MKKPKVSMRSVRPRLRTQKISIAGKSAFPGGPLAFDPATQAGPPGAAPPFPGPAGGGGSPAAAPGVTGE